MEKIDDDTKNILIGTVIGGVIGICAASLLFASKNQGKKSKSSLSSIGRVVVQMGEMLTSQDVKQAPFMRNMDKHIHEHENTIADVLELISSGIHLWEKLKRG